MSQTIVGEKVRKILEIIRINLTLGLDSLTIYEEMWCSVNPKIVGDENAYKNARIRNEYAAFFGPTFEAHEAFSVLCLGRIFDRDERTCSLWTVCRDLCTVEGAIETAKQIKKLQEDNKEILVKIHDYRGGVTAHSEYCVGQERISARHGDICKAYKLAIRLFNMVRTSLGLSEVNFMPLLGRDRLECLNEKSFYRLLRHLEKK